LPASLLIEPSRPMNKTRILLFIFTIAVLATSIFTYVFLDNNFFIRKWNLPLDPPGFHDSLQYAWASESFAQGYDPLIENPNNPAGHQLNYPRIWHIFFYLGINESHTNIIGTAVVLIFFIGIGIFWFSNEYDNLTYYALFIAFLSPAVMLGVERSNIELILFTVLAAAILASFRSSILAFVVIIFGSILKLYPIFGLIYLIKENKRKFWTLFLTGLGIFILYGLFSLNDLRQVFLTTPKLVNSSFGINVWWMGIRHPRVFGIPLSGDVTMFFKVATYVIAFLIAGLTLFLGTRRRVPGYLRQVRHIDAFRIGAGIYVGCFLLMNTHDYRLIFLIFTIPQLVEWYLDSKKKLFSVPAIALIAMGFSIWNAFIMRFIGRPATFVIEESCNWIMLATFLYLLFASMPEWFLKYLRWPFLLINGSMKGN
jgi:hypothetical protein